MKRLNVKKRLHIYCVFQHSGESGDVGKPNKDAAAAAQDSGTCATPAASFITLTVHLPTANTFYHRTCKWIWNEGRNLVGFQPSVWDQGGWEDLRVWDGAGSLSLSPAVAELSLSWSPCRGHIKVSWHVKVTRGRVGVTPRHPAPIEGRRIRKLCCKWQNGGRSSNSLRSGKPTQLNFWYLVYHQHCDK